jgi:hypothetical protein
MLRDLCFSEPQVFVDINLHFELDSVASMR